MTKRLYQRDEIGELLKAVRLETGISQRKLAERLGCSQATVSRLESGQTLATDEMLRRLNALILLCQSHKGSAFGLPGAAVGVSAGVVGAIGAVSILGSVGGMSAAGMTSGLAALGLGSMATGIGVVAAIPIATALAGYGLSKGVKSIARVSKLNSEQVDERLEIWLPALNGEPQDSMEWASHSLPQSE